MIEEHRPPRLSKIKRERADRRDRTVDPLSYGGAVEGGKSGRREDRPSLFNFANLEMTKVGEASGPRPGGSSRAETGRDDAGAEGENKDNLEVGEWNAVHDQFEKQDDTGMHLELEDSEEESGMDQEPASKVIEGLFGEWNLAKAPE